MTTSTPEFSRIVRLNEVGDGTRERQVEADANERDALARRFGLLSLDALSARMTIMPEDGSWLVEGTLSADLSQSCVATGESVPAHLEAPFLVRFVRDLESADGEELELSEEDCDIVALDGERIDIGETVAQSLALNLDPYPRAPNADARLREMGVLSEEDAGPFAALKGLKFGKTPD